MKISDIFIEQMQIFIAKASVGITRQILVTILIVFFLWLIRRISLAIVKRKMKSERIKYFWEKYSLYVVLGIGTIAVIDIWFDGFKQIWTLLGLVAAGFVVVLKEPLINLFGRIFIAWKSSFKIGDRIQIAGHYGDVVDLGLFQFTLMEINEWVQADQYTGRMLRIPNGKLFTEIKANYSDGFNFIWNEISIRISHESNWQKAKTILEEILVKHQPQLQSEELEELMASFDKYSINNVTIKPQIYTKIDDSGIKFSLRYFCHIFNRRDSENLIYQDILTEFSKAKDIMFAYNTTRLYSNHIEGKSGTKSME